MFAKAFLQTLFGALIAAQAWAIDEGIDYTKLAQAQPTDTADKVEVLEIFWYGCPHCYQLEPFLDNWVETMPSSAEFRRMPAVLGPHWEPHARAFYAAELIGVLDTFHKPLFQALHGKNRKIMTREQLADFAAEQGIDRDKFLEAYDSFFVNMKVRRSVEMGRRYGLEGVPAVIVNGKYRTSATQTGGNAKLIEVIDHLVREEVGAGATAGS
jgi:protein dithiol oxidoreductase (disulfide-forming)